VQWLIRDRRAATLRQFENPSPKRASGPDCFLVGPPFHPILVEDSERLSAAAGYGQRFRERERRLPAQWIQMEAGAGERHDLRVIAARPSLRDRREQAPAERAAHAVPLRLDPPREPQREGRRVMWKVVQARRLVRRPNDRLTTPRIRHVVPLDLRLLYGNNRVGRIERRAELLQLIECLTQPMPRHGRRALGPEEIEQVRSGNSLTGAATQKEQQGEQHIGLRRDGMTVHLDQALPQRPQTDHESAPGLDR